MSRVEKIAAAAVWAFVAAVWAVAAVLAWGLYA